MRYLVILAILPLLFCCKKTNTCGTCNCISYADTSCTQYPDAATANSLILGKWYLREVDAPSPPLSGGASGNGYYCDTSQYVIYYANGTVVRKGVSAFYPTGDSSHYQLFTYQDTCGNQYFADRFIRFDSAELCHPYGVGNYLPYYIPIKVCNNILIIGLFPEIYPPDQPNYYIYTRSLQ